MAICARFHLQFSSTPSTCNFTKSHKIAFVGMTIGFQTKKYLSKSEHSSQSYRALKKDSHEINVKAFTTFLLRGRLLAGPSD